MHNFFQRGSNHVYMLQTESVGKWTAAVAAKKGMDPRATEVVDAQVDSFLVSLFAFKAKPRNSISV